MDISLALLDELLDSVPSEEPRYLWATPEAIRQMRRVARDGTTFEELGCEDEPTYWRELLKLGAVHGRQLDARLGRWYRLRNQRTPSQPTT